jgi:hypothetical protein
MTDLKERTIARICAEFDMTKFSPNSCNSACCIAGNILLALGKDPEHFANVAKAARIEWATVYGIEDANRLAFGERYWGDLHEVTAEEAIAHINGAEPIFRDEYDRFSDPENCSREQRLPDNWEAESCWSDE